jgi:glycerol-3-phosphate dehydrogenase
MNKKRVIVIGGGSTGCATAHDLTLRGFEVVLIERGEIASGTTGRCSCFVHSGARYAVKDQESAVECIEENKILRRIMPPKTMEENNGVFILLGDDDQTYADRFFEGCAQCGIPAREISPQELLAMEPNLTKDIKRVAIIPDAIVEALRFALSFAATARVNGAKFLRYTEVKEFLLSGNRVTGIRVQDRVTGELYNIEADLVVNAGGPWANKISSLVGVHIPLSLSPGVHIILGTRLTNFVINRMHMPSSGDFVAPIGNSSILGTSSWTVPDPDYLYIPEDHIQQMREECGMLVPKAKVLPAKGINAASRPLIAAAGKSERDLSRTFECFDHLEKDNVDGFVTISGGKLATARAMAEKVSDMVCQKMESEAVCQTQTFPLVSFRRLYTG